MTEFESFTQHLTYTYDVRRVYNRDNDTQVRIRYGVSPDDTAFCYFKEGKYVYGFTHNEIWHSIDETLACINNLSKKVK